MKWLGITVLGGLLCAVAGAALAESEFPFDGELVLDAAPMPGSKRIPNMEIDANGAMTLEMWCDRVNGQVVVAGDTVTVMAGQQTARQCTPEQARADKDLLAGLSEATNWSRDGDVVLFVGARTLRFRVPTN